LEFLCNVAINLVKLTKILNIFYQLLDQYCSIIISEWIKIDH